MSVYVDDMFRKATVRNGNRSVTGEWCHMQADTREELDAMADKIGLRRSWIQYPDDDVKRHYDVTRPRRAAAVQAGAIEVGMLDLARMRAKWRAERKVRRSTDPRADPDWYDSHCPTCDAPEPSHTPTCAVVHSSTDPCVTCGWAGKQCSSEPQRPALPCDRLLPRSSDQS